MELLLEEVVKVFDDIEEILKKYEKSWEVFFCILVE